MQARVPFGSSDLLPRSEAERRQGVGAAGSARHAGREADGNNCLSGKVSAFSIPGWILGKSFRIWHSRNIHKESNSVECMA